MVEVVKFVKALGQMMLPHNPHPELKRRLLGKEQCGACKASFGKYPAAVGLGDSRVSECPRMSAATLRLNYHRQSFAIVLAPADSYIGEDFRFI